MIRRTVACLAFTSLLSVAPAAAQQVDTLTTSLRTGARSLSFAVSALGGGSGSIQYWRMRSERTSVGLMVVLHANYRRSERSIFPGDDDYTEGRIEVSAGPALRRYATTGSKVNPFFYGHVLAGYVFLAQEGAGRPGRYTEHGVPGALASGIGAEWFPVRSISLSGQTGLQLGANYMIGEGGPGETEGFSLFANTFTSSLSVNLYWPRHTR